MTSPAAVPDTAAGSGLAVAPSDSRRPFKVRKAVELGVLIGPSFVLFVFFVFVRPMVAFVLDLDMIRQRISYRGRQRRCVFGTACLAEGLLVSRAARG